MDRDFFLYVEGPRDGGILQAWARRISPRLARQLEDRTVILGGRRPARAVEHFCSRREGADLRRGLVVLDRDHHSVSSESSVIEPGLEVFTWRRRHIESYVLVPQAIRRLLGRRVDPMRLEEWLIGHLPPIEDEEAWRCLNAKEIFSDAESLALGAGDLLSPGSVARSMRVDEFHNDVMALYQQMLGAAGLIEESPQVIHRRRPEIGCSEKKSS